ncbi:MAG: hypothetical protein ACFFEE_05620, partial [Candidatus Thorarchaeota archaeon]
GENVEPSMYDRVRRASKLIVKFEKPKELTPEELRIEATQELRDSLTKSIRRISRFLATGEPTFPDIYITRSRPTSSSHNFGLQISEDGEFLFEEAALGEKTAEGIISRSAFLSLLEDKMTNLEISSIVGNGLSLALLKGAEKKALLDSWRKKVRDSEYLPLVNHLIAHIDCFSSEGFRRILSLLQQSPPSITIDAWMKAFTLIHNSVQVSIGTEEYHIIQGFCKTLKKPRKLETRRYKLESIHLAPRVICDPTPLGIDLFTSIGKSLESPWVEVNYLHANRMSTFTVGEVGDSSIKSIEYWLNLEDVYPSSGGLLSHGRDIIRRALVKLGITETPLATFESKVTFSKKELNSTERAVLERLISGQLEILSNTLVGSPQVIENLLNTGRIALLPGFNHIGVGPDFLILGKPDDVQNTVKSSTLEATLFHTDSESAAVVSAPSSWKSDLLESILSFNLSVWPIHSVNSTRNILRHEEPFPASESIMTWSDGLI